MSATLLPLELWLKRQSEKNRGEFPRLDTNYFELYSRQKAKFEKHIYPFVNGSLVALSTGASGSTGGPEIYTDHGLSHVEAVIRVAGNLLDCKRPSRSLKLNPYEVYLLLMAILSHDAGNIYGRDDHQLKVGSVLMNPSTKVIDDHIEARRIHDIAQSHTGKGLVMGRITKNTIVGLKKEEMLSSVTFRPRKIAALLRFADEICEDSKRVPEVLLTREDVAGGPSAPYLFFGNSITSVSIKPELKLIEILIEVKKELALKPLRYTNNRGERKEAFLMDIILERLGKISRERAYCFRFLHDIIEFEQVIASITVLEENEDLTSREHKIGDIDLSHEDYPSKDSGFKARHRKFTGQTVRKKFEGATRAAD